MPSNCLIFILTGVFIACRPVFIACRPTASEPLKNLNKEIQDDLDEIIEQSPVAQNLNTTGFHIQVLTKKENCAMLRLEAFIKLLHPVKIEDEKEFNIRQLYHRLYRNLKEFVSSQKAKSDQNCEEEEYEHREFKEILEDLRRLMQQLYCLQGHCN